MTGRPFVRGDRDAPCLDSPPDEEYRKAPHVWEPYAAHNMLLALMMAQQELRAERCATCGAFRLVSPHD